MIDLGRVRAVIPDLEAHLISRANPSKRDIYFYSPNCAHAAENSEPFLIQAGIETARREIHVAHALISLTAPVGLNLAMSDVILDPTYLQFAYEEHKDGSYPKVFLGTRGEMIELMQDSDFSAPYHNAASMYQEATWIPAHS